MVKRMGRVD